MKRQNIPNLISVLRILLIVPVVVLLVQREFAAALLLFTIAGASDAIDGQLARRYGWTTPLGGVLDPLADKAMMVSSFVVLTWLGLVPLWLLIAVVARDVVIVFGGLAYNYWIEKVRARPSWISKLNTLLQIILVMALMFDQGVLPLPDLGLQLLMTAVVTTVVLSGIDYIWTWGARALRLRSESRG